MSECLSCRLNADIDSLPTWERAYLDHHWRLAHASSSLGGYMVLSPRRHVEALDELNDDEAATLGPLLSSTTAALRSVVGCVKTYVMLFAELEGWSHVHFHIVPRMHDPPEGRIGPDTLGFLHRPPEEMIPSDERTRLAEQIGAYVRERLDSTNLS